MDRPAEKDTFNDASSQNYESGTRKNDGSSVKMIKNLFFSRKTKGVYFFMSDIDLPLFEL